MNARESLLRTISVGVDGSPGSIDALRWALALAEVSDAKVQAVMAWRYPYLTTIPGTIGAVPPLAEMESATLDALAKVLAEQHTDVAIEPVVAMGSGAQVLVDASLGQDLLVVGRRERPGLKGLGSTSRHVAIRASTSVAVIPPDPPPIDAALTVAVAVDGSDHSIDAVVWAVRAFPVNTKFVAVHSHNETMLDYYDLSDEARSGLRVRAEEQLKGAVGQAVSRVERFVDIQRLVYDGDPRTTVLDGIDFADVLVVGDRGHSGVAGLLLGSFASFAVGHAGLPVVVARNTSRK